ncbi:helix-turn-helix domain-containing protein [Fictibacillus phosphorivorans]|uniref:helix-turn-helix domain-containing protein n=1 Tax=Fictibacillus phosphorivorans TaxID=1221500 RepID=UPI0011A13812|nr:helix-turn-helix transcriptional regulator [Fictibacillus phosphorivorans]
MYGERLRLLRKSRKYTMAEIGEMVGIAKSSYNGYEKEQKKPPIDKLIKLAGIYNVSTDYILGLTDDPFPNTDRKNLAAFLNQDDLYWDDYKLSENQLKPIRDIFINIVKLQEELAK